MKKFIWKGYARQGVTYEFEVDGKVVVIASNAARYEDAITAADLPKDAKLLRSISFPIYNGKKDGYSYTDTIWAYRGSLPSGKAAITFLVEEGCLSKEDAKAIYDADEVRLDGGAE